MEFFRVKQRRLMSLLGIENDPRQVSDKLFGYFKKAYCINLPERHDRKSHVLDQFKRIGLKEVSFVNAVKPNEEGIYRTKGTHGCALSHRIIFREAQSEKLENILIFEDDVVFSDDFLERIVPIIEQLRTLDWDIFYFFRPKKGGNDLVGNRGDIISTHESGLVRTTGSVMTHAYAINHRCLDILLEKSDPEYLHGNIPFEIRAIDKVIAHLGLACYGCSSDLTYQDPGLTSSIEIVF